MLSLQLFTKSLITILFIIIHFTLCDKPRPVFETINEQARIDDDIRISSSPAILPYGNPLAGNSKQNARIHASNQQAMFNAERVRQHKAQLQRWNKGPQLIDSYMKAYHESQENHQLALEQQQATLRDDPVTKAPVPRPQRRPIRQRLVQNKRVQPNSSDNLSKTEERRKSSLKSEPIKITKADAIIKEVRNRNHRSYGSADYRQNIDSENYKTVYISPETSLEGVSIKPNANTGLAYTHKQTEEPTNLYTIAVPSNTKYTYPKQLQSFKSVQEISALNSLLKKNPFEQLSEFNHLLNSEKNSQDINKEIPIDFYFYLKDPSKQVISQDFNQLKQSQLSDTYASGFMSEYPVKDHTPITEEVDDIEDPNKRPKPLAETPEIQNTTTKSNNYYKVEVASQTISSALSPNKIKEDYQSLSYGYQPYYKPETEDNRSERYLLHSTQHTGVQHLLEDGTETSAFEDDNVSILNEKTPKHVKLRWKRSDLDTEPFLLPNEETTTQSTIVTNSSDTPTSESLIRRNPFSKERVSNYNVFLSPKLPIGEATDYTDDYDYTPLKVKRPNQKFESFYEDDDYNNYDDFSSPDYDFIPSKQSYKNYAPSAGYQLESKGSFSNNIRYFRRPNLSSLSQLYSGPPATQYGVPVYGTPATILNTPQTYIPPKIELPTISTLGNLQNIIEPIYMLTQTQLKELMGRNNLNIEHLDVYQLSKENKHKNVRNYPRKYRKRNPFRHVRNNLHKLHRFHV